MKEIKKWCGEVPEKCDICNVPLTDQPWFVDGKTVIGPWAVMCPECFEGEGCVLGTGVGQKYALPSGLKVEEKTP